MNRFFSVVSLCCALLLTPPIATTAAAQDRQDGQGGVSLAQLSTLAGQGQPNAQYLLGQHLLDGQGVLQNFAQAAHWMQQAAAQGQVQAMNRLGQMYYEGIGVARDVDQALHWLGQAAQSDPVDPVHIFDYATVLEKAAQSDEDLRRAAAQYRLAAEAGLGRAAISLAVLLQNGRGVEQDLAAAVSIYQQAAEQGDAQAQNNLGKMYVHGEGVEQSYFRAFELFEAAAKQGLAVAKGNLAVMYEHGFGVPINEPLAHQLTKEAARSRAATHLPTPVYDARLLPVVADDDTIALLQTAARAGDPVAQFQLAWLIITSDAPRFDQQQVASRLLRLSAETGYAPAMANLGLMYFQGQGVPQDYVLGQMWLVLAGSSGFTPALDMSFALAGRVTPAQTDEAQRLAELRAKQQP